MDNKETDTTIKINTIKLLIEEKKVNRRYLDENSQKLTLEIINLDKEIEALNHKNFFENCDLIANSYVKYTSSDINYTWQWFVKLFNIMGDDEIEYDGVKFKAKYVNLVYKNEDNSLVSVSYDSDGEIIISDEYDHPTYGDFLFQKVIHSNEKEFEDGMSVMKEFINKETNN